MRGHCYAVAGGKGGVGKTTTVVNTAYELSDRGHDVVVVDADLSMTNLGRMLGRTHEPTLHDVLADEAGLAAAIDTTDEVALLRGDSDLYSYRDADPSKLGRVLKRLRTAFDVVVVDTGAGISHEVFVPVGTADGTVLVTTPDETAVTDTRKTADVVERVDGTLLGAVVTRADEATAEGVATDLETDLLGYTPDTPEIVGEEPVVRTAPDSAVASAYSEIAGAMAVAAAAGGVDEPTDADTTASEQPAE